VINKNHSLKFFNKFFFTIVISLLINEANAQSHAQIITEDTIDRFVHKFMQQGQIPGCAIAILKDNTLIKLKGYGLASIEFNAPVTSKTKFLLDSQTKLFTAIALMKLQEQGIIKLDDPVNKYLDSIPASWHDVTIRNLLSHSSGIHDSYVPDYNTGVSLMEYTQEQLYHQAINQPLDFKTGDNIGYNNLGFFLLTIIIEKVTHLAYPDYMINDFFGPLGLTNISFAPQEDVVSNYATAYRLKNNKIVHMRDYAISQQGFSYMMKASVEDLAKFTVMFNKEKVISKRSIDEMRKLFITNDHLCKVEQRFDAGFIGLSYEVWFVDGYTAYFKTGGSGTVYMQIPALHLTVIILSNRERDDMVGMATVLVRLVSPILTINPASHTQFKNEDPSLTKQMKLTFINCISWKNDSVKLKPVFFSFFPHKYDEDKVVQQLKSFRYAGQYKMNDRTLVLYGSHADKVVVYNAKLADLDLLVYFYLSDEGKIIFADAERNE
jgi:CubicO group peptidase (beta-lactamase class C family)